MAGLSLLQPKPEETQAGPVTCPGPMETVLLAGQPPASRVRSLLTLGEGWGQQ